jgi:hypothetical protein
MKVFVSSTYIDLIDHRKAVERAINQLGQQFSPTLIAPAFWYELAHFAPCV